MTLTSAQAAKLLKKLNAILADIRRTEDKSSTFLAALGEDVESVRPEYSYEDTRKNEDEVKEAIRKVKHAINVFNTTTVIPEFNMTVDEMLVYIPQLTDKLSVLSSLKGRLPKERQSTYGVSSSNLIDYRYTNYDVEKAAADYAETADILSNAQLALDKVNTTCTMEIDIDI